MKKNQLRRIYSAYETFCQNYNYEFSDKDNFIKYVHASNKALEPNEIDELFEKILLSSSDKISITRRKRHPRRDWAVKKVGLPAGAVAIGSGITYGLIVAANMIAGTGLLIPVTANATMNILSTASVGLMGGLLLTPAIIATKNAITKKYYSLRYGNVEKILKSYDKALNKKLKKAKTLEAKEKILNDNPPSKRYEHLATKISAKLQKIEDKIQKSTVRILKLRTGSILTSPFRAIARTAINVVNRNRIHHIQKCAGELMTEYRRLSNDKSMSMICKNLCSNSLYQALDNINNTVMNDIATSKTYADKHNNKKTLVENIDIYAKMAMELQGIEKPRKLKLRERKIDAISKDLFDGKIDLLSTINTSISNDIVQIPDSFEDETDLSIDNVEQEIDYDVIDEFDANNFTTPDDSTLFDSTDADTKDEDNNPSLTFDPLTRAGFGEVIYENKTSSDTEAEITKMIEDYKKFHIENNTTIPQKSIDAINTTIDEINAKLSLNIPHLDMTSDETVTTESTSEGITLVDNSLNDSASKDAEISNTKDIKPTTNGNQVSFFDQPKDTNSESDDEIYLATSIEDYNVDENSSTIAEDNTSVDTSTKEEIKLDPQSTTTVSQTGSPLIAKMIDLKVKELKTQYNITNGNHKVVVKKGKKSTEDISKEISEAIDTVTDGFFG